jgi:hypothetical protein
MLFGRGGKPRGWTRRVVFRADRSVRGPFRRVVYKKSGRVRPEFALWVGARGAPAAVVASPGAGASPEPARHRVEEALAQLQPFARMVAGHVSEVRPAALLTPAEIVPHLPASMPVILSAGRDTSSGRVGGVQLCLDREERLAAERGMHYLRFDPWDALPALSERGGDPAVRLVLNGKALGATTMSSLGAAAGMLRQEGRDLRLVVHQLLGHSPEAITDLRRAAGIDRCLLWLHDFFTICPGYTLLRNRIAYCGAPAPSSNACTLCVFGEARPMHLDRIERFFDENPVEIVAPSHHAAELWTSKAGQPVSALHVVPHVVLEDAPGPASGRQGERPVTVGFVGAPHVQKGWQTFLDLMLAVSGSGVRFVVLSESRPMLGEDDWRHVRNTIEDPEAMTRAVRELDIDLALIWPGGPETFSLTTHEALAGGAFVLTNPQSGNVQAVVRATGRGAVLDDAAALVGYFMDGSAARLARTRRAAGGLRARPSDLSFAVPGWT